MSAEILINVRPSETRIAYVENGALADFTCERKRSPTLVGSVFRGKVTRVLPGMQAAFVDIGLDRAAFLYVGDVRDDLDTDLSGLFNEDGDDREGPIFIDAMDKMEREDRPPIQDLLRVDQDILVQVAKDPLGTKGARITTHISLPGRFIVYMPTLNHFGISRRIESETERDRLKEVVEEMKPSGGLIVRTAGEGENEDSLGLDLEYLERLWKDIYKANEKKKQPGLLHSELDVELRALRDLLNDNVTSVLIDDERAFKNVSKFVTRLMPKFRSTIQHYTDNQPLFDAHDIDLELSRSMDRRIWLKSGGYIVIDEAEALVVVDVNTGRYVGKKDLEDTIFKTNLEAVKEIAHLLRVRNVGGIVIIDFIDMERENHRERLLALLEEELKKDKAKTNVVTLSDLGLVEMTRKRIRPSVLKSLCNPCHYCDGKGYIKSRPTVANEIFRELERTMADRRTVDSLVVHCHASVVDWIYEEEGETLDFVENKIGRSVAFKIEPDYHREQFEIITNIKT